MVRPALQRAVQPDAMSLELLSPYLPETPTGQVLAQLCRELCELLCQELKKRRCGDSSALGTPQRISGEQQNAFWFDVLLN